MKENKKSSKGLIILIIILIICVLGLGGYIVYDKVLNNTEQKEINNKSNINYPIVLDDNITKDSTEKYNLEKVGNIKISTQKIEEKDNEYNYYYLIYINNNEVDNQDKIKNTNINKIIVLDSDYVLVEYEDIIGEGGKSYYIYNSNAKETYDMSKLTSTNNGTVNNLSYENNTFIIESSNYTNDYAFEVCKYNKNTIVNSKEKIKYLGDGKLGKNEIISSKTADEVIHEVYNMSCEEIKNSDSEELKYVRENIKEY